MNIKCPRCQSDNTRKDGHVNGKQRWECKDCGRIFRDSYSTKGYHPQIKQFCLTMYLNGMGFRAIERVTGIHHTTIIQRFAGLKGTVTTVGEPVTQMFRIH
ncbi:MAG: hypothetical protein RLZZ574_643 [Cyanobacteriota bacterium]|jgi:transposase-like protein